MKLVWINDTHLNFLSENIAKAFIETIGDVEPDAVLIGGDIAEAHDIIRHLQHLEAVLRKPIYFVVGSHDYYGSSLSRVNSLLEKAVSQSRDLAWLRHKEVISLSEKTALIGHDSWPDGRFGDYENSEVMISDFFRIEEFIDKTKEERLALMQSLAEEAADHFKKYLPEALKKAEHTILLTHVPPFLESSRYNGKISDDDYLPFFCCKVVGDVILNIMGNNLHKKLTVLCGHTHDQAELKVLPNVDVYLGGARYGLPKIQRIFVFE
jgi:predicted phosphohydrolase